MMVMTAYCGLVCSDCPSFTAHLANDIEALKKLAVKAREEWEMDVTWEQCRCTGCKGEGVQIPFCADCGIRDCAQGKGYDTCADCEDFGCEKVAGIWAFAPSAKENLEALRGA